MGSLTIIKKYAVLICLILSLIFIVIAASVYPGGSILDKNSVGFDWSKNFISNLFATQAINGQENPGRIWAVVAMAFQSIGYGMFFINMAKKIPSRPWAKTLKFIGVANLLLIFLIATPLHDVGTLSIILTLLGLFSITIFVLKSKRNWLKLGCIICLLTFYVFFFFYGFGNLNWAVIMQKVYNLSAILLVFALEYYTKPEDFAPFQSKGQEI